MKSLEVFIHLFFGTHLSGCICFNQYICWVFSEIVFRTPKSSFLQMFFKFHKNSSNTCLGVCFLWRCRPLGSSFLQNTFFYRTPPVAVSERLSMVTSVLASNFAMWILHSHFSRIFSTFRDNLPLDWITTWRTWIIPLREFEKKKFSALSILPLILTKNF